MGVIVACDFCAKPTVSIDFQGKQWIVLLRNPPYLFVFQRKQWIVLVLCAGPGGCLCASDLTLQIVSCRQTGSGPDTVGCDALRRDKGGYALLVLYLAL